VIANRIIASGGLKLETPVKFWDRIAERYARQPIADEAAYEKKLEVTRRYFTPESDVLELGCGTGGTAIKHAPFVRHVLATDVSSRMLDIAREKADGVANVTFEQASVDDVDVEPSSIDVVLALSLLHLLEDRHVAIAKVYDMLKPGGAFITSTVCLGDSMKWFRFVGPIGRFLGLMPLVRIFTVQELIDSLGAAGFDIDHHWQPDGARAVFIVAKKPA